jgi:hypothetical protein
MKKNTKSVKRGPGRPKAVITIPNKKFTFEDLKAANKHVTPLTLRKFLGRDMYMLDDTGKPDRTRPRRNSLIVLVRDETREPNHEKGLGRKTYVYIKRTKAASPKAAPKAGKTAPPAEPVTVDVGTASEAPVVPPTPVIESPAETVAPVAETPVIAEPVTAS